MNKDLKGSGGTDISCIRARENSKYKGPETEVCLVDLRDRKKASMFGAQQVRGKIVTQLAFPLKRKP